MKIVGRISPDEVPLAAGPAKGVWTRLARDVVDAHRKGEVLVVAVADREEYKRMVNGMAEVLRQSGYSRSFTAVTSDDGTVTAYCRLLDRETSDSVVVRPISRPRRRKANG